MALGADGYITKPFSEREILDAIAARVRRHNRSGTASPSCSTNAAPSSAPSGPAS